MSPAESLLEDAFASWLTDEGTPSEVRSTVRAEGTGPDGRPPADPAGAPPAAAAPRAASSGDEPDDSGIRARAARGHSPSARALVNASDTGARLASLVAAEPPATLRSRVLAALGSGRHPAAVAVHVPGGRLVLPPNEHVGVLHALDPAEAARRARIEALFATGGAGQEAADRMLRALLEQIAPYFDFDVVLVSAVLGRETIHRVHRGFPAELGNMDVVPRELSFCTHTVSAREPFVVENTLREAFFRSSALVRELGARAYLGVPLLSDGVALGALCAIATRPRKVADDDVELLGAFAQLARAIVVGDEASLRDRLRDPADDVPATLTAAGLASPLVYSSQHLREIVARQSVRARRDPALYATTYARLAVAAPTAGGPSSGLDRGLVVGDDDGALGVLVPARHPDSSGIVAGLAARGAALRSL